jgi:carboxyl-terminal processing protease
MIINRILPLRLQRFLLWGAILLAVNACKDREEDLPQPQVSANSKINNWIYDAMSEVYYWNSSMPKDLSKEQEPDAFFKQLLKKPDDRFSHITPDYDALVNSLGGVNKEAGYEFSLYRESSNSNNVIAQITYTKKNSPAEAAGLLRGDRIYKINNTQITIDNYQTLIKQLSSEHSINYRRFDAGANTYVDKGQLSLSTVELPENPNFINKVIEVDGQKIGYFMYNFFAPGSGTNTEGKKYDEEMNQIISQFKAAGINHLVLDLRYNGGGYVSSAVNLASLIGRGVDDSKVFYRNEYNSALQEYFRNDPKYGEDFFNTKFIKKDENIGNQLTGKLIVLVSNRTASASELLINGLKPFMDVTVIGKTTVGKNVGSVAINDDENPENKWGILPIVFRSYNSLGQSDYGTGFVPNIEVSETEEVLQPLGDPSELMLRRAIEHITGSMRSARPLASEHEVIEQVGSSLDLKARQEQLIDNTLPKDALNFVRQ